MALTLIEGSLAALETLARIGDRDEITDEEREVLGRWAGWGPLARAMHPNVYEPAEVERRERIMAAIPEEHFRLGMKATPTAFYTPTPVADAMWRALLDLGFTGGKVLEPGCGSGIFMDATPPELAGSVQWVGVERDPTSARIAKIRHPEAAIVIKPMEKAALAVAGFDAVLGNVPFEDVKPYDPTLPKDWTPSLHSYFLWRAGKALRPGGIAVLITSRYTMDEQSDEDRFVLSQDLDLLGAALLPTGWERSKGSDVVAAMLVLRKREASREPAGHQWLASKWMGSDEDYRLNEYWLANPAQVLGERRRVFGDRHGVTLEVRPTYDRSELPQQLDAALARVTRWARSNDLVWTPPPASEVLTVDDLIAPGDGRKLGSLHVERGRVVEITARGPVLVQGGDELKRLVELRNVALDLIAAEADPDSPDARGLRAWASWLYQDYARTYGPINRATITEGKPDPETGETTLKRVRPRVMSTLRRDPDYTVLLALEHWDDETGEAGPAPLLTGRFNRRPVRKDRADDPAEAVALCMDELNRLDEERIAELLGVPRDMVLAELGTLAFRDPGTGALIGSDEYLSGNVRVRLEEAIAADATTPGAWERNIEALKAVQPLPLTPAEITLRLGSPVLTAADVKAFVAEVIEEIRPGDTTKTAVDRVEHQPVTSTWRLHLDRFQKTRIAAAKAWGTERISAYALVEEALNGRTPVIFDEDPETDKRVKNPVETMIATTKQEELQQRFQEWVWEDHERSDRLAAEYNRRFNSEVPRQFTGDYLTFPGLVEGFEPWPNQRAYVARALATRTALCGHTMGAGKTAIMFLVARTLRRLGLARCPMIVVPNHLVEQVAADGGRLFPGARILMATSEDTSAERKKLFAARVATGNYDAVVITRTAFTALGLPAHVEAEFTRRLLDRYQELLFGDADPRDRTTKEVVKIVERLEQKLEELLDRGKDRDAITFDMLGCDYLLVDEFHEYKNRGVVTKSQGFSMSGSRRALDMAMKLDWLRSDPKRTHVGSAFTGTPVANSLAEIFIMLSYLDPGHLEELGLDAFDAWAGLFILWTSEVEVAPDGGSFRVHSRPRKFVNLWELLVMFGRVAEVLSDEDLKLDVPEVEEILEVVQPSDQVREYVLGLVDRADQIRKGNVHPKEDNMLKVCGDGRAVALDPMLKGIDDNTPGKVERCVERVLGIWNQHLLPAEDPAMPAESPAQAQHGAPGRLALQYQDAVTDTHPVQLGLLDWSDQSVEANRARSRDIAMAVLAELQIEAQIAEEEERERQRRSALRSSVLQIIFCDLGTPRKGDNQVYGKVKRLLVKGGMAPGRIRWVQDARTVEQKKVLFAACRAGEVDVLMGSTSGLGVGTNVQQGKLIAVHHLDAPWRPADIQQRRGRMVRPGNPCKLVYEFKYVVERTFDSYMWQMLERKLRFILQVLRGKLGQREIEDIGDLVLSYAQIKAAATGNTKLLDLAEAEAAHAKLRVAKAGHIRTSQRLEQDANWNEVRAAALDDRVRALHSLARWGEGRAKEFLVYEGGETKHLTDHNEIGKALALALEGVMVGYGRHEVAGTYRGMTIEVGAQRWGVDWILRADALASGLTERIAIPPSWMGRGQAWRIAAELDTVLDGAGERAAKAAREAADLRERAVESRSHAFRPFDREEELVAARERYEALQAEIDAEGRKSIAPQKAEVAA